MGQIYILFVSNYLKLQYPKTLAAHIPNGGKRTLIEAVRFKKMGVNIGDKATAAYLEKALPAIGNMITRQLQIDANNMKREEMALTRQIALGTKAGIQLSPVESVL